MNIGVIGNADIRGLLYFEIRNSKIISVQFDYLTLVETIFAYEFIYIEFKSLKIWALRVQTFETSC